MTPAPDLERAKFEYQKQNDAKVLAIEHRKALWPAWISAAAVLVTIGQLTVTANKNNADVITAKENTDRETARLLMEDGPKLTDTPEHLAMGRSIANNLSGAVADALKRLIFEVEHKADNTPSAEAPPPSGLRVFIHYSNTSPETLSKIERVLIQRGYNISSVEQNNKQGRHNAVDYFTTDDTQARSLSSTLQTVLRQPFTPSPQNIKGQDNFLGIWID